MKTTQAVDTARISLLLNELRLPAIKLVMDGMMEKGGTEPAELIPFESFFISVRGTVRRTVLLFKAFREDSRKLTLFEHPSAPLISTS